MNVRTSGVELSPLVRGRIRQRFGRKLGKFATHIERATVRFADENGPRGGVDTVCRVKVVLSGRPSVVTEERAHTASQAFDRALDGAERATRRQIGRAGLTAPRAARGRRPAPAAAKARAKAPRSTARRNLKENLAGMTSALEDSTKDRPSRRSTRKSVNRARQDNQLRSRAIQRTRSPKRRARSAAAT